ncbi:unnamed protein product [Pedinophyceae sp. YPF-701]|nr:unnamed protein product [Pedinophyceae sp. YPF-701]
MLKVPDNIAKPPYADTGVSPPWSSDIEVHDAEGIKKMRASGKLAAEVLTMAGTMVKAGVTTDEIDRAVHKMIVDAGAYPSPLNYGNFPKSVCTSINECMCHGIPDSRPLQDGDIMNIDVTVYLDGHHGDCSRMFYCGAVSDAAKRLCDVNRLALEEAIKVCGPGVPFREIGAAIEKVAKKHKLSINRDFVGHGVGKVFHASPAVYPCRNMDPAKMQLNQTFTIEPIFTLGSDRYRMWDDKWTAVTRDGSLAAQHEHTLLITENGAEILTPWHEM